MKESYGSLTCEDVDALLDDYLDGELSEEDIVPLERHFAACDACAGERYFEASLLEELKDRLRRVDAPTSLVAKVGTLIRAGPGERP